MTNITPDMGWQGWLARWDAQQEGYLPHREERFAVIVATVAALGGDALVLDLGCGPGSLSAHVLARLPAARVVAVDGDPFLLSLGGHALGDFGGHLQWVDADLREAAWPDALPSQGPFDAVISTTALHWLHVPELATLYRTLARVLRPGGVFVDGDHMPFDDDQPAIASLARHVEARPAGGHARETWSEWWAAAEKEPAFGAAFAERARRRLEHAADEDAPAYTVHRRLLFDAGFAEVGTLWQRGADRVLVSVR